MGQVLVDITTTLDGFIAGPNDSVEQGLGEGGERIHDWVYGLASWRSEHGLEGGTEGPESDLLAEAVARTGAIVMGRQMFDFAEAPWGEEPPFHKPVFVVTHRAREPVAKKGGTTFTFVTDGFESAVRQAQEAAGDRDVGIAGGASVIQQGLKAGLVDELQIHVAPVLLGEGRRLFESLGRDHIELEPLGVVQTPAATHLRYRVNRASSS